ncbi:MAG TPA: DUF1326 domain-containing protein [Gammaproteobacteria bacterium]|nr:DUF1326 domain-containing protein [Gammaproteobacteria bacterium]
MSNLLEPKFLPIEFEFDLDGRTARVAVPGVLEAASESIKNSATGDPSRMLVRIPDGFEYFGAETASATTRGTGDIKFDVADRHSSLTYVHHTPTGLA